jgi:hypothetical protein
MKRLFAAAIIIGLSLFQNGLWAQVDESELFGSTGNIVDVKTIESGSVLSNVENGSVSFSGVLYNRTTYAMRKDWITGKTNWKGNSLFAYLEGNVSLDIRLQKDVKAFVNLDAYYTPQGQDNYKMYEQLRPDGSTTNITLKETLNTIVNFKEIYLSANLDRKVYLVLGKQVLQWGRTYFWQPTDLINIDRKDFFNLDNQIREGNFGLKLHIPFGTRANIYGFLDANGVKNFDGLGTAGKLEFLLGRTEFALSAWQKKTFFPVYGVDFSTRLLGFSVAGEAAFSTGDNQMRLKKTNVTFPVPMEVYFPYREREKLVYRACISLSRSFTWELEDRITVVGEFLHNSEGYAENMFAKDPLTRMMFLQGFYKSGYYGKDYAALFTSMKRFFLQDLSFSMNGLANLTDLSYVVSTGLTWTPVFNFSASFNVSGFFGPPDTEYVFSGVGANCDLNISVRF